MAEWSKHLDIDNLQETKSWATLAELQTVVPFHLPRYNDIMTLCKTGELNKVTSKSINICNTFSCSVSFYSSERLPTNDVSVFDNINV